MKVIHTVEEAAEYQGLNFVPTMGALHIGHEALIREAKKHDGDVAVSIFINPKQFGPSEDFDKYPRDMEKDLSFCNDLGVKVVFCPKNEEMYPDDSVTPVTRPALSEVMCGRRRPGHFDGVTTAVARLFRILRPSRAFFGWKDAQQLIIVRALVEDLELGVDIVPVDTVRERDGLASSSRNQYLSVSEREKSSALYRALLMGAKMAKGGSTVGEFIAEIRGAFSEARLESEYVEVRYLDDLSSLSSELPILESAARERGGCLLAGAVVLDRTRLIDNIWIFD